MSKKQKPLHVVENLNISTGRGEYNVYAELLLWPDGSATWRYKPGFSPKEVRGR